MILSNQSDGRCASTVIMSMAHDCKKFKTQRLPFLGVCVCFLSVFFSEGIDVVTVGHRVLSRREVTGHHHSRV